MEEYHMESQVKANTCTFCGKDETQVGKFIAGPDPLRTCDNCLELGSAILLNKNQAATPFSILTAGRSARCSFCGVKMSRVWKMLQGVRHNICSECVEIGNLIMADRGGQLTSRSNVEELKTRNKKHWIWILSWHNFSFTVKWR